MAYAGDLKSPVLYGTCGFDPHPGHTFARIELHRFGKARFEEGKRPIYFAGALTFRDRRGHDFQSALAVS
jgi:hypothetical protein